MFCSRNAILFPMNKILIDDTNLGVIILCPDYNSGGLKSTTNSIKMEIPNVPYVTMVANDARDDDVADLAKYSRICKGGKTITSLIDFGVKEVKTDWCMVVMSGSRIKKSILRKYGRFATCNKDILFPVLDRKYLFDEASINGILLNSNVYDDIGGFGDTVDDIQEAKLLWAGRALDKGYKFKALVGARLI